MKHRHLLLSIAMVSAFAAGAQAATVQNVDLTLTSNPTVGDVYFYNNPAGNTWTVNGNILVGNGTTADSRLFVGLNVGSSNNGLLTLTSTVAGSSLLLNGYHSADAVLGRLGYTTGNLLGTINITGGLAVTMGGRDMRYDGNGTNVINITDGSLNYTNTLFGWAEAGGTNSFVSHVLGANGSLIVAGVFSDVTGFNSWAVTSGSGVESGDITVSASSGLTLNFANDGTNTTITAVSAVPEPSTYGLMGAGALAGVAFVRRRRRHAGKFVA